MQKKHLNYNVRLQKELVHKFAQALRFIWALFFIFILRA